MTMHNKEYTVAVCYPCGHTVSETQAPSWKYEGTTFYFCSIDCEEEVRGEPAHWQTVAKMPVAEQKKFAHGHGHHAAPAAEHEEHDHAEHGHEGHDHGHEGHKH